MKKYNIPGWQSWSPYKTPFFKFPSYLYSPHGVDHWLIEKKNNQKQSIKGWCSWYAYGENINEEKILQNAIKIKDFFSNSNEKYVLIDDGWTKCGDWKISSATKLPKGMKNLSQKIKNMGLKPGLWIAPFWVDPKSNFANKHPEWIVKTKRFVEGFPILPFSIPFFKFIYIVDMENPKVISYLKSCIKVIVEDWGFELIKLDFLNSIYFNPKYKSPEVPDKILNEFLTWIRKTYPSVYTIGCGCPLGPAAGAVDAMRISADIVNPYLQNIWPINIFFNSRRLSLLERNLKYRKHFSKIWHIDPDVLVSSKSNGFSMKQVDKLYKLITRAKGVFFLGDDLTKIGFDDWNKHKFQMP